MGALDTLSRESEPLGLKFFWIKTKIQKFVAFIYENMSPFLTALCTLGVLLAAGVIFPGNQQTSGNCGLRDEFPNSHCLEASILVPKNKDQAASGARERGRLNPFSTQALSRITGYRWDNFVSNDIVLHETGVSQHDTTMPTATFSSRVPEVQSSTQNDL